MLTAAGGPPVTSLVGDLFPADVRGRVLGWVKSGELVGAGAGFLVAGVVVWLTSWRGVFVVLALMGLAVAWVVARVPEPRRGGENDLPGAGGRGIDAPTHLAELVEEQGIEPKEDVILEGDQLVELGGRVDAALPGAGEVVLSAPARFGHPCHEPGDHHTEHREHGERAALRGEPHHHAGHQEAGARTDQFTALYLPSTRLAHVGRKHVADEGRDRWTSGCSEHTEGDPRPANSNANHHAAAAKPIATHQIPMQATRIVIRRAWLVRIPIGTMASAPNDPANVWAAARSPCCRCGTRPRAW